MFKKIVLLIQDLFKTKLTKDDIKKRLTSAYTLAMADALSISISDQKNEMYESLATIKDPTKADEVYIDHIYRLIKKSLKPVYEVQKEIQYSVQDLSYDEYFDIEMYKDKLYSSVYSVAKSRIDLVVQKIATDILGTADLSKLLIASPNLTDQEN